MKRFLLTPEEKAVREILIDVASHRDVIFYSDLCEEAGLTLDMSIPADRVTIGGILGDISIYEHEHGRPLLSSIVVTKNYEQGDGFFRLAESLGYGEAKVLKRGERFEYDMMNETYDYWG